MSMECIACGVAFDCSTCVTEPSASPEDGDISVCLYCGSVNVFAGPDGLREPTHEELDELSSNVVLQRVLQARAMVMNPEKEEQDG